MDVKQAIEVLIKAASLGEYSELEKLVVDQAIDTCSKLQFKEPEKRIEDEENN